MVSKTTISSRRVRTYANRMRGALLFLPFFLVACNPFLSNYSGEKWPEVTSVDVVMKAPSPEKVRWIGRSDFTVTRQLHDSDAKAAAKQVGADFVEWSDRSAGNKLEWTSAPVAWHAWSGNVAMVPLPVIKKEYRYQARFYRSISLGGQPIRKVSGDKAPKSVPPVPASSKSTGSDSDRPKE